MKTTIVTQNKKLPNFIKSHKIFSKFKNIKKVFPDIGLPNCSVRVTSLKYAENAAEQIKAKLIKSFSPSYDCYFADNVRAYKIAAALRKCEAADFIKNNKIVVPLQMRKELTNFNTAYIECKFNSWDRPYYLNNTYYHIISHLNLSPQAKVVFSSEGSDGMWDMATMSMRGISSCQSWNGCYKRNLIGSIVDPCAGIIYLTNGVNTKKGSRMVRRALVRYVVNKATRKPALLIEKIYPQSTKNDDEVIALFTAFLKKQTKGKLPIVTTKARQYVIPNSKIVKKLSSCGRYEDGKNYCKSYRDSGIAYAKSDALYLKKIIA